MPTKSETLRKSSTEPQNTPNGEQSPNYLPEIYRELESIAKIGYWEWDFESDRLKSCSAGYADLFGMTVEQVMTEMASFEDDQKLIHPEDLNYYVSSVKSFRDSTPVDIQYRIIRKDGEVRHVHERGIQISDDQGNKIGTFGSLQDITEQVIASQKLQAAHKALEKTVEQRFKDFANIASDWLYELDENFRYSYFSESRKRAMGIPPENGLGKTPWDITNIPPDEEEKWEGLRQQLQRHEAVEKFEHSHISRSGKVYHGRTSAVPFFDEDGKFQGYRGAVTDITSIKRTKERLNTLYSAIDMLEERISLYDENDGLIFCNERFRKLNAAVPEMLKKGVTLEQQLRASIAAGSIPEAIGREEEWLAKRMAIHRDPKGTIEVQRQDGIILLIREQKLPDGKTILISSDVGSERRARVDIEYANRTQKEFLANMSHELRTPLNGIIGLSEFMLSEVIAPIENEQYKDYINDIHESAVLLTQIISDILDISKIEAKETIIEEVENKAAEIIDSCVRIIKGRADASRIALKTDVPDGLPDFLADNRQMKQILLNLMSNAVKFSDTGDTVTISARLRDDRSMELRVQDEGIGIAKKNLRLIMEPFHQVRTSHHHTHGGTGLGLTIVKSMIDLHGGHLEFQSEPEVGTTVIMTLPPERTL